MKKNTTIIKETNQLMIEALYTDAQKQLITISQKLRENRKAKEAAVNRYNKDRKELQEQYTDVIKKYEEEVASLDSLL